MSFVAVKTGFTGRGFTPASRTARRRTPTSGIPKLSHERALLDVRARYFFAQNQDEKDACRAEDLKLRQKLSAFIEGIGGSAAHEIASSVAAWNPYKPDRGAGYFDPESMFGVRDGFDITIGNPPYVRADEQSEWNQRQRGQITASEGYETLWEKWDLFVPFIERAYKLLKPGGVTTLIVSDAFCHSKYAQKPQNWFLKNARILRLDFCSDLQIFDAAVHNLIYFFQRADGTPPVMFDDLQRFTTHTSCIFVPWHSLHGVRNNSLKKTARYVGEKPPRPDLPKREKLEATSRRFAVKYLLGVMNSSAARDFLRANRRSNIHLYPDDWKKLPIPDVPPAQQQPIVALVDQILTAKRADADANISALEAELDGKINELYGIAAASSPSSPPAVKLTMPPVTMVGRATLTGTLTVVKTKRTEAGMKELLRDRIVPKLTSHAPYFSIEAVRTELEAVNCPLEPATLNSYLHELTEAHFIYDAGRGWYSSLATPFKLNREPVSGLVRELDKTFPLLEFSCWSTAQIGSYGHHLLAQFVAFVHTNRDNMETVAEALRKTGWTAYLNPTQQETAKSFRLTDKTVVVRPAVSRAPVDGKYATVEKILVDLCAEATALRLLDAGEYQRLVANLAGRERISVATLAQYAERRNLKLNEVLAGIIN